MARSTVAGMTSPVTPHGRPLGSEALAGRCALAVVGHPDDESFGLGAVLSLLRQRGGRTGVVCFTHGEASTLGCEAAEDLGVVRADEFARAAAVLGVSRTWLLDYPDGDLSAMPLSVLSGHVLDAIDAMGADLLVLFDIDGITGHPDHIRATEAARAAARTRGVQVLLWALPASVAVDLNTGLDTHFVGRPPSELDLDLVVDRAEQRRAIAEHRSQATGNRVLAWRLDLLGDHEWLRWDQGDDV